MIHILALIYPLDKGGRHRLIVGVAVLIDRTIQRFYLLNLLSRRLLKLGYTRSFNLFSARLFKLLIMVEVVVLIVVEVVVLIVFWIRVNMVYWCLFILFS